MFVTQNQFYVFTACLLFGGVFGPIFSLSFFVKKISCTILKIFFDIAAFIVFSAIYVVYAYILNFPDFRPYMAIGAVTGVFLYMKSWHIIVAKPIKMLYNIQYSKQKNRKEEKHDGIQVKKAYNFAHGRGGSASGFSSDVDDLSIIRHKRRKQRKKRVDGGKGRIRANDRRR